MFKNTIKQTGFNLIELMIAMTIGGFLIIGAAYAFQEAKKTYIVNDNVARLYENAQFVLDILEEDIRLSSYWGLHNKRSAVEGDSNVPGVDPAIDSISGDCDDRWALDLRQGISGTNGVSGGGNPDWSDSTNCIQNNFVFKQTTDTLVLRHADFQTIATPSAGTVYINSDESPYSQIFTGATAPTISAVAQNYAYLANGYYITENSYTTTDAIPMLRRMTLESAASNPRIRSREIVAGVEDLQLQFGVDYDQRGQAGFGSIDQYVNPDNGVLNRASTRVLTVRLWLLLRSPEPEINLTNTSTYNYANVPAYTVNDNFRRLLISKTIQIRNIDTE